MPASIPTIPGPGADSDSDSDSERRGAAVAPPPAAVAGTRRLLLAGSVAVVLALPTYVVLSHPLSATPDPVPTQQGPVPSLTTLQEQLRRDPSINGKINLSLAYINSGDSARAIPLLLSVVAEAPQNATAWNNLCVAHTLQRSYDLAIQDCENAVRLEPNFQLARNNLQWARQEKAAALHNSQQ